jgi:hypothetical protein
MGEEPTSLVLLLGLAPGAHSNGHLKLCLARSHSQSESNCNPFPPSKCFGQLGISRPWFEMFLPAQSSSSSSSSIWRDCSIKDFDFADDEEDKDDRIY